MINLHCGDCLDIMRGMPDNSVDLVLTDPPYGLSFMGKKWDYDVPSVEIWAEALRVLKPGGHLLAFAGTRTQHRMACRIEDAGFEIRDMLAWLYGSGFPKSKACLKPALEPITMARKPLVGTVAANVLEYGTGGLNIDACRVGSEVTGWSGGGSKLYEGGLSRVGGNARPSTGRWPANLIHDGSEEATAPLAAAARFFYCAKASKRERDAGCEGMADKRTAKLGGSDNDRTNLDPVSERFRTSPSKNNHPTVKPIALMEHLVKLASRPNSIVLDPFMGSGTTGIACRNLGREFIGIERDPEYFQIASNRILHTPHQTEIPA